MKTVDKNMIQAGVVGATMLNPATMPVGILAFLASPIISGVYLARPHKGFGTKLAHSAAGAGLSFFMMIMGLAGGFMIHGEGPYNNFMAENESPVTQIRGAL